MPAWTTRPARTGDEQDICRVCSTGFTASSHGVVAPGEIERRVAEFYSPERVARELDPAPPSWLGYVVGELDGEVVGAAGGSVDDTLGVLLVLYLQLDLRGRGLGTALLEHVTSQHRAAGAIRQRVWVSEGNEMGLPFYRARGFVQTGREALGPGDPSRPGGPAQAFSLVLERAI